MIHFYPTIISSTQIQSLVLYMLPFMLYNILLIYLPLTSFLQSSQYSTPRNVSVLTLNVLVIFLLFNIFRLLINNILVPATIAAGYAWNSVPTDGTNILRGIPAIVRKVNFPIDISLNNFPKLTQNNSQDDLVYLKLVDSSRHFLSQSLKLLLRTVDPLTLIT